MVFHFLSPAWAGICKTARQSCLIPYSTLSRCNIPRTPLRLPCSPAEVSLSPGFQGSLPTLPHAGDAAHIFPSSVTIPCPTCVKALPHTSLQANISPRSSPLIISQCSRCFVPLHTDIPFPADKNCQNIDCQGSPSSYMSMEFIFMVNFQPAVTGLPKATLWKEYLRADRQQPVSPTLSLLCSVPYIPEPAPKTPPASPCFPEKPYVPLQHILLLPSHQNFLWQYLHPIPL